MILILQAHDFSLPILSWPVLVLLACPATSFHPWWHGGSFYQHQDADASQTEWFEGTSKDHHHKTQAFSSSEAPSTTSGQGCLHVQQGKATTHPLQPPQAHPFLSSFSFGLLGKIPNFLKSKDTTTKFLSEISKRENTRDKSTEGFNNKGPGHSASVCLDIYSSKRKTIFICSL